MYFSTCCIILHILNIYPASVGSLHSMTEEELNAQNVVNKFVEDEQIINISSNRRMKQLMDWLSNSHWTTDTGMLTYLFLSNDTQANGDHSCPVRRHFEEFTSHRLDLRKPMVHPNLALKSERSARVTPGHLSSGAYYLESSKPTHLLYFQP